MTWVKRTIILTLLCFASFFLLTGFGEFSTQPVPNEQGIEQQVQQGKNNERYILIQQKEVQVNKPSNILRDERLVALSAVCLLASTVKIVWTKKHTKLFK